MHGRRRTHHLGYYWHWDPESVAGGVNFNLTSIIRADFTHNDGAGSGAPTQVGDDASPVLAAATQWVDTGVTLPADADWLGLEWRNATTGAYHWTRVRRAALTALTAASAGSAVAVASSLRIAWDVNRQAYFGRTSAHGLLLAAGGTAASNRPYPLKVWALG